MNNEEFKQQESAVADIGRRNNETTKSKENDYV